MTKMIERHSKGAIFMHWFNAICWILLLFSGFASLENELVQPIGTWWVALWNGFFASSTGIIDFHIMIAKLWIIAYVIYIIAFYKKDIIPFLQEILIKKPIEDIKWCIGKGTWLILGSKGMKKFGLDPVLAPQGFYNAGQKLVAIVAVLASILLVLTGAILTLAYANALPNPENLAWLIQLSMLLHFICAGIMAILLPIHIYMAAFAPGEAPALKSMFTGQVPEEFAKHHNPLWYQKIQK